MTNDARQRDTFLCIREILEETTELARQAGGQLQSVHRSNESRTAMAGEELASKQSELVRVLEGFLANASAELLDIRVQYQPVPDRPAGSADDAGALAHLVNINHAITETLGDVARKVEPEEHREQLVELHRAVETLAQRVSMARVTVADP